MKLFIRTVPADMTVAKMQQNFDHTFGADVLVRLSDARKAQSGKWIRSAFVEVLETSRELDKFIAEIRRGKYNVFIANGVEFFVEMQTSSGGQQSTGQVRPSFVPRIV
jgi:hypothetical protein